MLTIEIKGIGFQNRGAELMLNAIIERFQQQFGEVQFAVEPPVTLQQLKTYGLALKARYLRRGLNLLAPLNLLPSSVLSPFNIVKTTEVDIVIDASGYSYGDPWTPGMMANRLALEVDSLKARKIPIVLLPQALGPFNRDSVRKAFLPIYQNADLIFPRDEQSLNYLSNLGRTSAKVEQAPDFSNLVEPEAYEEFILGPKSICLVPNQKMIDKTAFGEAYLAFCRDTLRKCNAAGFEPFILVHEQAEDALLAQRVVEPLNELKIPIIIPSTAKQCKWVIAQSQLVIASRYHGLVSALSEAVPVFATSWSHKYQSLLIDYDVTKQLIDLRSPEAESERVLALLSSSDNLKAMRSHLKACAIQQRNRTLKMWECVFDTLH